MSTRLREMPETWVEYPAFDQAVTMGEWCHALPAAQYARTGALDQGACARALRRAAPAGGGRSANQAVSRLLARDACPAPLTPDQDAVLDRGDHRGRPLPGGAVANHAPPRRRSPTQT